MNDWPQLYPVIRTIFLVAFEGTDPESTKINTNLPVDLSSLHTHL